jgi:subtilisin family serine protease
MLSLRPVMSSARRKAVWGRRPLLVMVSLLVLGLAPSALAGSHDDPSRHSRPAPKVRPGGPNANARAYKLDSELTERAKDARNWRSTQVLLRLQPRATLPAGFRRYATGPQLRAFNAYQLSVPDNLLSQLCGDPATLSCHFDRPAGKFNYRTSLTTGTRVVQQTLGLTGAGVTVAVIDSGIANWHDDLTNRSSAVYPYGNQRVLKFVDFVDGNSASPHDEDGHGTHVAGIIAGNGYDSNGQKAGAAPDASLISLRVLDANGNGTIGNIIAALDWVLQNHVQYNIRVVNMSVGAAIHESAWTDPLTLAAKAVVDAGVVVVAAAGNFGKNSAGLPQYGGISAPGNAPWVLTVGGSSTNGTPNRGDDAIGTYSSRGPTYLDWTAKPDLVAPGTGTVSLASAGSNFYLHKPNALSAGTVSTANLPYLSLTGTSMAAPVVSGTVALMLQANPALTPNAVKAILQYTAQQYPGYNGLTQGAGFLNAVGAVRLARFYANAQPGDKIPTQKMWSKHIIWGNHRLMGGAIDATANAFSAGTTWGAAHLDDGENIVWGTACGDAECGNIVWGTSDADGNIVWGTDTDADGNIVWGTDAGDENIVWGTDCGGADCDNVIWGTVDSAENIVWGTADAGENIVWGTAGLNSDQVTWTYDAESENIVWGTADGAENIVWGTADDAENIVWGTDDSTENIVWGTDSADGNIVWGTSDEDGNIVWGTANQLSTVWLSNAGEGSRTPLSGSQVFDRLKDKQLLKLLEFKAPPATTNRPLGSGSTGGI